MSLSNTDHSAEKVALAVEENLYEFFRVGVAVGGRAGEADASLSWVKALPARMHNYVYATKLTEADADERIERVKSRMRAGELPNIWLATPTSRPSDLAERLERHGFLTAWDWTGMAIGLEELADGTAAPEGFCASRVTDEAAMREWTGIVTLNLLHGTEADVQPTFEYVIKLSRHPRFKYFLGRAHGKAVSAAATFTDEAGVVGLYNVASCADERKKGYGKHVVLEALREGRAGGGRTAILQASAEGRAVYEKLGFRPCCAMRVYYLDLNACES